MPVWDFPRMVLRLIAVLGVLTGALTVLSCSGGGGGGDHTAPPPAGTGSVTPTVAPAVQVAANDVVAPVNTATIQSLEGQALAFPSGIGNDDLTPVLANEPIMVTLTNTTSATPTTTVTAPNVVGTDGQPASFTADTTFGSCLFRVRRSTFRSPGPQEGQTLTVRPCNLNIHTAGMVANGQSDTVEIFLQLGGILSRSMLIIVSINPSTGVITVNGVTFPPGTGSVTIVTGTGGSGNTP